MNTDTITLKSQILEEAYRNKLYDQVIKKVCQQNTHFCDDLKQDVFIMLYEKKDDLIIDLYNDNKLIAYFTRIVQLQYMSNNSKFHYVYRKPNENIISDYNGLDNIEDEITIVEQFDLNQYVIDHKLLTWFEYEVFNLYYRIHPSFLAEDISEKLSLDKMVELLGIKRLAIFKILAKIKLKIYQAIINDITLSNDIPFENLTFMQEWIDKHTKKKKQK